MLFLNTYNYVLQLKSSQFQNQPLPFFVTKAKEKHLKLNSQTGDACKLVKVKSFLLLPCLVS